MEIQYRAYSDGDLSSLQELMLELGYSLNIDELKTNIHVVLQRGGNILVTEKDNQILGCVCVILDARLAEGVYAEIVSLVVSEKARGQGVGTALVLEAESWASTRVNKIRVRANSTREKAHNFYMGLGYENMKAQKIFIKKV